MKSLILEKVGAVSFWFKITGWEEGLFMWDGSAKNILRSSATKGWDDNRGLSLFSLKWVPVWPGVSELKKATGWH